MQLIDFIIVVSFFIITLVIGIWDKKKTTLDDYWVNGRKTSSFFLFCTMFSTYIGAGAILGVAGLAFSGGGLALLAVAFSAFFYFALFSKFFAHKINEFGNKYKAYTLPDFFEIRYSERVRLIGAIVNLFAYGLFVALQILGIGIFVSALTGLNANIATIVGSLIVIIYTSIGGLRADIRTDVFQFIIMLFLLVVFLPIIIFKTGGFNAMFTLPKEFLLGTTHMSPYIIVAAFLFMGSIVFASAEVWQRAYSARNQNTAKNATLWASVFIGLFAAMAVLFGVFGKILLPNSSANYIVADLLHTFIPTGLYGLVLCGFFAAIMSTADTLILITSMTLVRDFLQKSFKKNVVESEFLKINKIVTFAVGIFGLIIALLIFNVVHLTFDAISFYVVLLPSVVFGFYWKRANETAAFWSILLGLITLIVFLFIDPIVAFIPAIIISFIVFFVIALLKSNKNA